MPPSSSSTAAPIAAVSDLLASDPLARLNPAQRAAVEHGITGDTNGTGPFPRPASPLLVIAGAGSGKTNTLAHRVAHLIVLGADPGPMSTPTRSFASSTSQGLPGANSVGMRSRHCATCPTDVRTPPAS